MPAFIPTIPPSTLGESHKVHSWGSKLGTSKGKPPRVAKSLATIASAMLAVCEPCGTQCVPEGRRRPRERQHAVSRTSPLKACHTTARRRLMLGTASGHARRRRGCLSQLSFASRRWIQFQYARRRLVAATGLDVPALAPSSPA